MLCALVNGARAIEEPVKLCDVVTLRTRLLDGSDEVLWSAASELPCPQGLLPVTMVMVVKAMLAVVIAVVSIIAAPFITAFVIVTWWTIGSGIPGDILTVMQVSLLSVSILFGGCEYLADRRWWLPVELSMELIMMAKSLDKAGDNFKLQDVWNTIPDLG